MRKILIGVLIVILIAGIAFTLISGIALGSIQISSVQQLAKKDKEIEDNIRNLKNMKEITFAEAMDRLTQETEELKNKREEYAALINVASEEVDAVITAEKYQIEYLWVKLGNYATKNGVTLKLNILNSSKGLSGVYDLEFTLNGKYAGITEFIYEIENDSTLGFKIEKFLLVPTSVTQNNSNENKNKDTDSKEKEVTTNTDILTATFTVRDIEIDISSQQSNSITNALNNIEETKKQNTTNSSDNSITNNLVQ